MADLEPAAEPPRPVSSGTSALIAATYDRHQRELFSFALRASRDSRTAEDLVTHAFSRLVVEAESGRVPGNVRAWLYREMAKTLIAHDRQASAAEGPVGARMELSERDADLDLALGELAADERTALLMAAAGFNGMEIADTIGRSGSTTRTLMSRSRLRLRHRLDTMAATR